MDADDGSGAAGARPVPADRVRSAAVMAFAADLRRLRDEAGAPSYRHLAARTHFAPSTVAEAMRGVRMPTEAVVRALAAALEADPDVWARRLRAAVADARRVPAVRVVPVTGPSAVADIAPVGDPVVPGGPVVVALEPWSAPPGGRPGRRFGRVAVAAALTGLVAGAAAFGMEVGRSQQPAPAPVAATPAASPPLPADGADPLAAGCDRDARVIAAADLRGDDATKGRLEIRWSLRCGAVWAQLQRDAAPWPARTDAEVTLTTSDGRSASYTVPMVPLTTVMFRLGQFCAAAQAVAHDPDFRGQATAVVPCVTP